MNKKNNIVTYRSAGNKKDISQDPAMIRLKALVNKEMTPDEQARTMQCLTSKTQTNNKQHTKNI